MFFIKILIKIRPFATAGTLLIYTFTEKSAEILLEMFSRSPLSSILNAMIPLCEPASAQKIGLEHNVWYLVVQGAYDNHINILTYLWDEEKM